MKTDIRWAMFVPTWAISFLLVLSFMGTGRGLDTISGNSDFGSGFVDVLEFVLFSSKSAWSIALAVCCAVLLVLLDKHADADLAGKRALKLLFLGGFFLVISATIFVFVNMTNTGFSWVTLVAFGIPTIIATLAALRKRTVS